jgi:hypothetical protein
MKLLHEAQVFPGYSYRWTGAQNAYVGEYWRTFCEAKGKTMAESAIKPEFQRMRAPCCIAGYLTMERPTLPVPVRVATAEELTRMGTLLSSVGMRFGRKQFG